MRYLLTLGAVLTLGCSSTVEQAEPQPAPPECEEPADCDDGNPCTVERCGLDECIVVGETCS
jgi:hypothetical protein